MKNIKLFLFAALAAGTFTAKAQGPAAQDIQDTRVVGIVDFSAPKMQDSLAAKNVNAAVARVLVQTQRFTILDVAEWKKTQAEIDRQKGAEFMERDIIQKGKTLGAKVLVIGTVKNAEIYKDGPNYSARADYEIKFVDVESSKSIASRAFTGNSETLANVGNRAGRIAEKLARASAITGKGNWQTIYLTSAGFSAMSEAEKNTVMGKLIDAIETTTPAVNAWVRGTFNINLLCLGVSDEDKKKGFQHVLIEGGNNISMGKADKLTLVVINQIESPHGKIQDEAPVADLEVEDVRANTTMCKVISGGKKISNDQVAKYRVVFKQDK